MYNMFIVTKKIDSENISKVCRTCLREDNDKMVCLFIGPPESSLGAKLQSLSCLEVSQGDGLPEKMCDRCVIRAESALLFREQCRAADQALRQAAIQVSKDKELNLCNYHQPNQTYIPLQYSQNPTRFPDYYSYSNYQDLYVHNQFHSPIYQREEHTTQHMQFVEGHNAYLNLSRCNNSFVGNEITYPMLRQDDYNSFMQQEPVNDQTSCALHCSICNYTFNTQAQLAYHCIIHNSGNVDLPNDEVIVEVEENSNLERNLNCEKSLDLSIENSDINLNCNAQFQNLDDGQQTYGNSEKLNSNVINSSPTSNEKSSNCLLTSEIIRKNKFKCEICSRLFNQKSKLDAHQVIHNRLKLFNCAHCGKSYSSKSKLVAHTRLHTQINIHKCNICQKIFSYPSYLSEHMKTHNPESKENKVVLECVECKKKFTTEKGYKKHRKFHTGKGLFQCDICDKLFSQKYTLKVHMNSHEPTKLHKCDLCNKTFNKRSNLVEHVRTHTKVKPFKCKTCGKSFSQSSHLKSHELSHNSIRRFQCKICGKQFKLSSHLKRHAHSHTGLKMYKCDQCDQMFSHAFSLRRHSKKHSE